ncbi:MAG: type I secretion system permease/ATPase [Rhizobiaceae bacterium]
MNQPTPSLAGDDTFRTSFAAVAAFLGRPSAETVIFAGVPGGGGVIAFEEIEHVAGRLGIEATRHSGTELRLGQVDLPVICFRRNAPPIALLAETPDGRGYVTDRQSDGSAEMRRNDIAFGEIQAVVAFSLVYGNASEEMLVGTAQTIDRKHWLGGTVARFWRSYLRVVLAAVFINVIALASPLFVMNVYDRVLPNQAFSTLWVLALGVSAAMLFDLLLKTARAAVIDHAGRRADLRLSYLLFEKVLNTSMAARPPSTGEFANRVTQYEFVREFFTSNTLAVLIDTVFVVLFLAVIYWLSGWIAIVPASAFILAVVVGLVAQQRIGKWVAASLNESGQRQALLVESIGSIETVKSLQAEAYLLRRWRELSKNAAHTSERIKQLSSAAANVTQFIQQLVTVAIIIAGAYAFAEGDISTGAIIATVMLANRAVAPLGQIAVTLARLRQALLSLRVLNSIMSQPEDLPVTTGFVNRAVASGAVTFRDVRFRYPGSEHDVIDGMSFAIRPGERVGLIGRIGSGKTTVGRLVGCLYPPTGGDVLVDGIDVRQYHPAEVRRAVAVVGQAGDLFSGTVKENLLMAKPGGTDEEILKAARLAGVDEFVSRHPRGYDMPVGERGGNLSGGQRQAVAIARLLMSRPKVVFLDEPSGSMDLATERRLIQQLGKAFEPGTTLIISTHRFSMLELVDRLIVIEQGKVAMDGPKAQVMAALQQAAT